MAIVVEEDHSFRINWLSIIMWLVITAIVVSTVYYVFFQNPQIVEVTMPANLQGSQAVSLIKIDPGEVLDSPKFKELQAQPAPIFMDQGSSTKLNPFMPF